MKRQSMKVSVNELVDMTLSSELCNMGCFEIHVYVAEVHMPFWIHCSGGECMNQQGGRSMVLWIGREYALKYGRDCTSTDRYICICLGGEMGFFLCSLIGYWLQLDPRTKQAFM
jgi:hypothetical protein